MTNPIKNIVRWFCAGFMPLFFGGDQSSSTQQTTQNYDQRRVDTTTTTIADLSNRSQNNSNNTSYNDLSNRSTTNADFSNRSTTNADISNRSTNNSGNTTNADFSNRSSNYTSNLTTTNNSMTDLGSIAEALGLASSTVQTSGAVTVHAYDYADQIFAGALDFANKNANRELTAFDRAATIQNDALSSVATTSGSTIATLKSAYADAKGTTQSQQQIILAVLAVAGIFALSSMRH